MNERTVRLRAILDSNWQLLVAALLLLALAGGWIAYGAYVDPPQETTTEVVSSWTVEGEWSHGATVTESNSVFPTGTELRDRSVYFGSIAPTFSGAFGVGYDATSASNVAIDAESRLVTRSVSEEGNATYWSESRTLDSTAAENVGDDETVRTTFSINTTALDERIGEIREEIGADPGTLELFVETTVTVEGTFDGESRTVQLAYRLPLELQGTNYRVDDPGPLIEEYERTETTTRTLEPGLLDGIVAPFLLVLGLLGGAGVAAGGYTGRFAVGEAEREWLAFRDDRAEFDEWITRISLPEETFDRPVARAASLQDLVDFAIDNSTGVVEDPDAGTFYVVTDDYVYTYEPPVAPEGVEPAGGGGGRGERGAIGPEGSQGSAAVFEPFESASGSDGSNAPDDTEGSADGTPAEREPGDEGRKEGPQ
ncbi:MAG: DUF5305 domain-containing protein [Haloferacaceae archaeon]